jgi:hypothetical protein
MRERQLCVFKWFAIISFAISLAATSSLALAVSFYVDFESGSDSNDGLAKSRPWKRFPGMDGESTGKVLSPGDVICLRGGSVWTNRVVAVDGVIYRGNCPYWGQGRAAIATPAAAQVPMAFFCNGCDDVTVEGITFSNGTATANFHGAVYVEGSAQNPVVNFTARNCLFINSGQGLMLRRFTQGAQVLNVEAYGNTYAATVAAANSSGILIAGPGTRDIVVDGAVLHENGRTAVANGLNEGRGITISGGASFVSLSNIYAYANGSINGEEGSALEIAGATNISVMNSRFEGATAAEIKNAANNLVIRGNLFSGSSAGVFQYGYYAGNDSSGSTITDNVIVSTRNLTNSAVKLSSPGTTNEFKRNTVVLPAGHRAAAIELNTLGTSWSLVSWNTRLDNNQIFGGAYYSITVQPGPSYVLRTLAEHRLFLPYQAGSEVMTTGR